MSQENKYIYPQHKRSPPSTLNGFFSILAEIDVELITCDEARLDKGWRSSVQRGIESTFKNNAKTIINMHVENNVLVITTMSEIKNKVVQRQTCEDARLNCGKRCLTN